MGHRHHIVIVIKRYLTKAAEDIPVSFGGSYSTNLFHIGQGGNRVNFMLEHSTSYSRRKSMQSAFDLYGTDVPLISTITVRHKYHLL